MTEQIETSKGNSKAIVTNQPGIHEKLASIVTKHAAHRFQKPIQDHTQNAFEQVNEQVKSFKGPIIFDACCGVGQSTRMLAQLHPEAFVVGVDKSAHRIERNVEDKWGVSNFALVRADLNDFYRLLQSANWPITEHFILYPNPWPKSKHVQRRWHGSAIFPQILTVGQQLTLRSNWLLYLQEFQFAAELLGKIGEITLVDDVEPLTPFEAKYQGSGQVCWQLTIQLTK